MVAAVGKLFERFRSSGYGQGVHRREIRSITQRRLFAAQGLRMIGPGAAARNARG
jgi:hypothetical protein